MTEEVTPQTETQTTETPTAENTNDLTINDLAALKNIIDVASSRGAFKPNEMVAVGQAYNKLSGFLDQIAKQVEASGAN